MKKYGGRNKVETTIKKCDNCGKIEGKKNKLNFKLGIKQFSESGLEELDHYKYVDFCAEKCLLEYLKKEMKNDRRN